MDESKQTGIELTDAERKAVAEINDIFAELQQSLVDQGRSLARVRDVMGQQRFDAQFSATSPRLLFRMPIALRDTLMDAAQKGVEAIDDDVICDYCDYLQEACAR